MLKDKKTVQRIRLFFSTSFLLKICWKMQRMGEKMRLSAKIKEGSYRNVE